MQLESLMESDSTHFKVLPVDLAFTTVVSSGPCINVDN